METKNKVQQQISQIAEDTAEGTQEHQDRLLVEYEVAHSKVAKWDNATWQSAAIFLSASLAGFVVVAQISNFSIYRTFLVCIIGLTAIFVLSGWYRLIQRWHRYKRITYYRIREIEGELDFWQNRYIQHLALRTTGRNLEVTSEAEKERLRKLERSVVGPLGTNPLLLIKVTILLLILSWIATIVYTTLATFFHILT